MADNPVNETPKNETPLESWKEIAIYLKRDVSTVKRWEKEEALPVHRHLHQSRASVYAYASELDAWRAARNPAADATAPVWLRSLRLLAAAAAIIMALFSAGDRGVPPAQAAQQGGDVTLRRVWSGGGVDNMGSPSPDGKLLSYVDWSTGDLAIRDLSTGANRRLTNKGTWTQSNEYAEFSVISPDARLVAYAWFNEEFYELRVVGADGTNPRVLHSNKEIGYVQPSAWSADGRHLYGVFSSRSGGTNQIVRVTVSDGAVQVLKSFDWRYPHNLKLSADGRHLAYDFPPKDDSTQRDIYLLATDGSREIPLVKHAANDFVLGWTSDGRGILFGSDRSDPPSIWLQPVEQGAATGVATLVRSNLGKIRPIGMDAAGTLYYSSGGGSDVMVAEMDPVTGSLAAVSNATERMVNVNAGPDWSPDGKYLAFMAGRGQGGASSNVLVIRTVQTGDEKELRPAGLNVIRNSNTTPLRWSPDGRSLLFLARDAKGRRGYYQANVATGAATVIFQFDPDFFSRFPEWSADGKALFYRAGDDRTKSDRIIRREAQSGRETVVHQAKHIHSHALSRDRKWLAVASSVADDSTPVGMSTELLLMPADGGQPRTLRSLPRDREFTALAWSGDGQSILFMVGNEEGSKPEVWRIGLNGGEPQPVHFPVSANYGPWQLRSLRFHPDGKRVAFDQWASAPLEIWALENLQPIQKAMR